MSDRAARPTDDHRDTTATAAPIQSAGRRAGTLGEMEVDRIWSAAELEALSPDERATTIRAGFVTDPADVPADLAGAAKRKAAARIAAADGRQAHQ